MPIQAVLFDLGGVVLGSPIHAIRDYERELGFEENAINRVAAQTAPTGAWSRLERGELALVDFYAAFEADCRAAGLEMDARVMMTRMAEAANPRPEMLAAIETLKRSGLRVGALTNNWAHSRDEKGQDDGTRALKDHFHVFIESSVEGLRKPDPAIYRLARERLGVPVEAIAFLDDIGPNLKPPREMGMTTIKVETVDQALDELERVVGFALR